MSVDAPAAPPKSSEPAWYEQWFGDDYLALYPHRDGREAARVVALLLRKLAGKNVDRVLDLACGAGRHSRALNTHWWTTGLDLSQALLSVARSEDSAAPYVRGDMRSLPFRDGSFSLVVNLFTSFGYFSDDDDHLRVITGVAAVTAPDGLFVLDYLNADQVVRHLKPTDETVVNGIAVDIARVISPDGRFVEKRITLREKKKTFVERVRLFGRAELESLVTSAGFAVREVVGDYQGSPWTGDSERTMLFSVKS
ncbi:MAG: class I SAM-dependent methyltransferase [Gemmatimonadota bacterium]|nr:class I SAM-dependent methyltransferase [Gemmatimonadota bacterium]